MSEIATTGSTELAPPLAYGGGNIGAEDLILPRIKASQPKNAGEETAPLGALFSTSGEGTEEVIAKPGEKLLFFVLAEPTISYSWEDDAGEFQTAPAGDPRVVAQQEQYGAYSKDRRSPDKGYNFLVALPEVDPSTPYKVLFVRSSAPAGKIINTILTKAAAFGPYQEVPFELSAQVKRAEYTWSVFNVRRADIKANEAAVLAEKVEPLITLAQAAQAAAQRSSAPVFNGTATDVTDAPAID